MRENFVIHFAFSLEKRSLRIWKICFIATITSSVYKYFLKFIQNTQNSRILETQKWSNICQPYLQICQRLHLSNFPWQHRMNSIVANLIKLRSSELEHVEVLLRSRTIFDWRLRWIYQFPYVHERLCWHCFCSLLRHLWIPEKLCEIPEIL